VKSLRAIFVLLLLFTTALAAPAAGVKVIALFSNKALLQVGEQQKIVKSGETFEGVMLQSASGRGAVVVIDGKTMALGLNQSISGNFKKPNRDKIRIVPDAQGMYFVNGKINGAPIGFLVDTGATYVTMSGRQARALNIDFKKGMRGQAQTAAAVVEVWQITLNSVSIGDIKLGNVTATVIAGNQPGQVLLGNSFLRHTDMQQAGSALVIRKRY
jgi:aspartyl protease family protein